MLKLKDISDSSAEMLSSMPASGDTPQGWPLSLFLSSANTPALPSWEGMYSFMQAPCPLWASVSPSVTLGWGEWTTMVIQVPSSRLFFIRVSCCVFSSVPARNLRKNCGEMSGIGKQRWHGAACAKCRVKKTATGAQREESCYGLERTLAEPLTTDRLWIGREGKTLCASGAT